ncbi:oligoribonuclease [Pseudoalteromonas sp. McH1-7]|uniref:Oligoribonuclease n=1 Tax=Pseudoalteromonas peptidolytica F12-50-A1 TaxID=1315280 RepID=A0A8I0T5E8_9GAMM|nr:MULTISPECIES: oligoribonuclease [Pseudoalteromonas]MBE0347163.1 oligoribonuclease [Pseudoalteromonas peptidolytica F12-50-A1]MDW7549300.1 oligoribonuclease [Pseudoalteromonas peptidolytica]NLR13813.1 oligoribonuclease [Pseudoalteromonas peptidolytica]NUZ10486.1 oligoribonuclease [Pseudoalteromonas sp. McH1-7]RRS08708.1 oligoribonuclease [Pseudoalteromonas sp. J010]
MSFHESNLIWLDLEMTGLEPKTDKILEIATVITDGDLNILAEGPVVAIHQSNELLDGMDEWCTNQHGRSGLTDRCKASKYTEADAIKQTLDFLKEWVPPGASPMCGNSIGQDRRFLNKYMPELEAYFHYRNLDVSTIKELARRWKPELLGEIKKKSSHLALDDIKDSIMELKVYQEKFFKV